MDDRFECRYDYVLQESDLSTDSADEVKSLLEEKDNDLHCMDDFRETMYNYVWLPDNETLSAGSNRGEEKTGRMDNLNHTEEDTLAKSQSDEIDRPDHVKDRRAELTEIQGNGIDGTLTNVKSKCFPCGSGKENCTCSDGQFESKEKENINIVENVQPNYFVREKGLLRKEEKSARKQEISKSVDNIIISEICPSFKNVALSKQKSKEVLTKMSRNKKNCIFGEVFEPGKETNKIYKGRKSHTFPVKTDRLSESFWCKKDDTLFGSSSRVCDDRSDFRITDIQNIPDHDKKTSSSEQNLSVLTTSDLIDLNAANEKFSPMLRKKTKSKSSGKMNKTQKSKVRYVRGKHLEGVQRDSMLIGNSWLRCMPTPTTKKLLAGKIKKKIHSISETSNDKHLQTFELEQFASNIDEMSGFPKDKVEDAKLLNTDEKYSVSSSDMRKENNISSKNKRKENICQTQTFTNKQPEVGNNVNYENENVECSTFELGTKNERKLRSKMCPIDEKTSENFDLRVCAENYKKHDIVGNIDSKCQPRQSRCKRKKDAFRFRSTYVRRKGKEVKVFRTRKGIGRVAFRYPCNFCGNLFSKGYVWKHERTHIMNDCKKINQHDQQKIDTDRGFPTSKIGKNYYPILVNELHVLILIIY